MTLPAGVQVLADLPLAIDPDEVLRFQGYKKGVDVPSADVRALFDEALAAGTRLMTPRAVVRWLPVARRGPDTLEIECWKHGSCFSLLDGTPNTLPATQPVPVYEVRIDGDDVLVVIS